MPDSAVVNHSSACLWMSAGVITYRLCDRDFDCDNCPLDAALRHHRCQVPPETGLQMPCGHSQDFPDDRRYTSGHWWVQVCGGGDDPVLRCGLDVFAATIIARCCGVACSHENVHLVRGDPVCEIDFGFGVLSVGAPISGSVASWNSELERSPERLVASPYDNGWIVELIASDVSDMNDLVTAQGTRQKSQFDLQWFRRRIATQILADDAHCLGRTSADGGELVADLRQILGGAAYAETLRGLIH